MHDTPASPLVVACRFLLLCAGLLAGLFGLLAVLTVVCGWLANEQNGLGIVASALFWTLIAGGIFGGPLLLLLLLLWGIARAIEATDRPVGPRSE